MSAIRSLALAAAVLNVLATAVTAEVMVEKDVSKRAKARFFERVQAGELDDAVAHRGQPVEVKPGKYHLRVPCDSMKRGVLLTLPSLLTITAGRGCGCRNAGCRSIATKVRLIPQC